VDVIKAIDMLENVPNTFSAFTQKAIELDSKQYASYLELRNRSSPANPVRLPASTRTTATVSRTQTTPAPLPSNPSPPRPSMAMDLSQVRHLSPEEKKRRQDQNLCFYCASPDHMSKGCPNKISKTLANVNIGENSDSETITFDLGKDDA
jgi:hypothetical protein